MFQSHLYSSLKSTEVKRQDIGGFGLIFFSININRIPFLVILYTFLRYIEPQFVHVHAFSRYEPDRYPSPMEEPNPKD